MTRETYIKVAKAIRKQMRRSRKNALEQTRVIITASTFASLARNDSHRFDAQKFYVAAGIPTTLGGNVKV